MKINLNLLCLMILSVLCNKIFATTVTVSTIATLQTAMASANSGDTLVLANGTYNNATISISKSGIIIRPTTNGGVIFTGTSSCSIAASNVVFRGFQYKNGSVSTNNIIEVQGNSNTIYQCNFFNVIAKNYIRVASGSQNNVISNCNFESKPATMNAGPCIQINTAATLVSSTKIRYCTFLNSTGSGGDFGNEQIRIGLGTEQTNTSACVVEFCYFENTGGADSESISVKSVGNILRFNTQRNNPASSFVFRSGSSNSAYSNFFINSGGIRIKEGQNHNVYNNYFSGGNDESSLEIMNNPDNPVAYVYVYHNTFFKPYTISLGGLGANPPSNVFITNNIFYKTAGTIFTDTNANVNFSGNIFNGGATLGRNFIASEFTNTDPLLRNSDYAVIASSSPAINTSNGTYTSIVDNANVSDDDPNILFDIEGKTRPATKTLKDVGCNQASASGTVINKPMIRADAGPNYLSNCVCVYDNAPTILSGITISNTGQLSYTPDAKGNVIPDFSGVGYKNSEASIPTVAVVLTVSAVGGDNTSNIQNAINTVAAMPLQSNGFRGAILFNAGTYSINNPIYVNTSGIVLRGIDTNTVFYASDARQYYLINIQTGTGKANSNSTQKRITNAYVPCGSKSVTVESGHTFQVGDWVNVIRQPNAAWITALGMDTLSRIDPAAVNWIASTYSISYERKVLNVSGNVLTFDAPMVDIIDSIYATGYVVKFTSYRIENCGVENIKMTSTFSSSTDENHAWIAVYMNNLRNGWVKNVKAYSFGYGCVDIDNGCSFITVDSCSMIDPISIITDERRYCFNVDGQRNLVKNCNTKNGRHDYVNGSRTPGPNVFYNCSSTLALNDIGPHHRWATGILFDNIVGDRDLNVQNRMDLGSGHGWSGGQIMFWNCTVPKMILQDMPTEQTNWAYGCVGNITNVGSVCTAPFGVVQSANTKITATQSLFLSQLATRIAQGFLSF